MENKKKNIASAQLNENELENVTGGMDTTDTFWNPLVPDTIISAPSPFHAGDHTFQAPQMHLLPISELEVNDVDITFDMEVIIRKQ